MRPSWCSPAAGAATAASAHVAASWQQRMLLFAKETCCSLSKGSGGQGTPNSSLPTAPRCILSLERTQTPARLTSAASQVALASSLLGRGGLLSLCPAQNIQAPLAQVPGTVFRDVKGTQTFCVVDAAAVSFSTSIKPCYSAHCPKQDKAVRLSEPIYLPGPGARLNPLLNERCIVTPSPQLAGCSHRHMQHCVAIAVV